MSKSSLMWVINKISSIERDLQDKEIKGVGSQIRKDLRGVINELNQTVNELLMENENYGDNRNNN